jgi:hypothetical protein
MYKIELGNEEINLMGRISLLGSILNQAKVFTCFEFEHQGGNFTHKGYCKVLYEGRLNSEIPK